MNKHPTFLGLLGILPNQLRTLLKESDHEHREEALLDINKTLFFAGFRVWTKRQQLAKRYWNAVGQIQKNGIKKPKRRRKKNLDEQISESKCQNLFIILLDTNLSKQRPNKCPCRNIVEIKSVYQTQGITAFVSKDSIKNDSRFNHKNENIKAEAKQIVYNTHG